MVQPPEVSSLVQRNKVVAKRKGTIAAVTAVGAGVVAAAGAPITARTGALATAATPAPMAVAAAIVPLRFATTLLR